MNKKKIIMGLVGILASWSCEKLEPLADNPLDPNNPEYISPEVTIIARPSEGEVVNTHVVIFEWEGNDLVTEYRSRLDTLDWSDWSDATSITLDYLDEGDHRFQIQSRYASGDTSYVVQVAYTVDAVKGPALMFYPRRRVVAVGETTAFQILAEEVMNLTAAEFTISFDPTFLEVISVSQGSMFQDQGQSIFLSEYDNELGKVTISTALLGGENPSAEGTGNLAILEVKVKEPGPTTVSFDGREVFRDPENNDISISETVEGLITQ